MFEILLISAGFVLGNKKAQDKLNTLVYKLSNSGKDIKKEVINDVSAESSIQKDTIE